MIIISTDGSFHGLTNSNKPKDRIKQRIMNEKVTRMRFDDIKNEFIETVINPDTQRASNSLHYSRIDVDPLLAESITDDKYILKNDNYRNKILNRIHGNRGFKPTFFGGLQRPGMMTTVLKKLKTKSKNVSPLVKQVKPQVSDKKSEVSFNNSSLKN